MFLVLPIFFTPTRSVWRRVKSKRTKYTRKEFAPLLLTNIICEFPLVFFNLGRCISSSSNNSNNKTEVLVAGGEIIKKPKHKPSPVADRTFSNVSHSGLRAFAGITSVTRVVRKSICFFSRYACSFPFSRPMVSVSSLEWRGCCLSPWWSSAWWRAWRSRCFGVSPKHYRTTDELCRYVVDPLVTVRFSRPGKDPYSTTMMPRGRCVGCCPIDEKRDIAFFSYSRCADVW